MDFFYYSLKWKSNSIWYRAKAVPGHHAYLNPDLDVYQINNVINLVGTIVKGGYHISHFLPVNEIRRKIEGFSQQEYNKEEFKIDEHIKFCISNGQNLFNRSDFVLEQWDYRQLPLPL